MEQLNNPRKRASTKQESKAGRFKAREPFYNRKGASPRPIAKQIRAFATTATAVQVRSFVVASLVLGFKRTNISRHTG
jgi:hypothetical protein